MKKKKKGSAFVTVIVISSILAITGATMLTVTASDYKMRKVESKRIKNLYEADSGINIVENIIIKTSQKAIKESDEYIKKNFASFDAASKTTAKLDETFKKKFYEYLNKPVIEGDYTALLKYLIENKLYIDENNFEKLSFINADINEGIEITIEDKDYVTSDDGIFITVTSSFESKNEDIKGKKIIQTSFKVKAPNYNSKISEVAIYPVLDNKTIAIDGNMKVEGGTTEITGDVWVKGNQDLSENIQYAFDKYVGGIILDKTNFELTGNLYTFNTLTLKNNVKAETSKGNVYANNLYVGKYSNELDSKENEISIDGDLILNNDLALNSSNSKINISKNFYGINDKKVNTTTAEKAMNSSSIIVNETLKTSEIIVENDSYIMGVAYLDATDGDGNQYQTGESVSVKGNYLAYTDVDNLEDGYALKYYSPLQLLESKKGDSSLTMKADYFTNYYSEENTYSLNTGGVKLIKEVYSVGASITSIKDKEVSSGNLDGNKSALDTVNEKQKDYALNVLAMGNSNVVNSGLESIYSANSVINPVDNQIDFSKSNTTSNISNGDGFIFISDESNLIIEGNTLKSSNSSINGEVIKSGIIITNGDIEISGNFEFEGTIITSKNINLIGSGTKSISYNAKIVRDTVGKNKAILEAIFTSKSLNKIAEETKIITNTDIYEENNFLEVIKWKIVK